MTFLKLKTHPLAEETVSPSQTKSSAESLKYSPHKKGRKKGKIRPLNGSEMSRWPMVKGK